MKGLAVAEEGKILLKLKVISDIVIKSANFL